MIVDLIVAARTRALELALDNFPRCVSRKEVLDVAEEFYQFLIDLSPPTSNSSQEENNK